jgi:hypothetical protein
MEEPTVGVGYGGTQVIGGLTDLSSLGSNYGASEIVLPENESLPCSDMEFRAQCQHARRLIKLGLYSAEADAKGNSNDERTTAHRATAYAGIASDKGP